MKKTNETVYRCDHCNKAMVSAGFMKLHERMCKKNPNNQHQCFKYCKHLIKEQFDIKDGYGHNIGSSEISFTCAKIPDIEMYSYKLERYSSKSGRISGLTRMPLECELYESLDGHDFSEPIDDISELNSEFSFYSRFTQ